MVLHKVSARRDIRQTVLYSKQFDKLFHHVSYGPWRNSQRKLEPFGDWDAEENRMDKGQEKSGKG